VALGLLLAGKQYCIFALPLALLLEEKGKRLRTLCIALCAAVLTVLPFAAWNFGALWHDVVTFLATQPIRLDGLSFAILWPGMQWIGLLLCALLLIYAVRPLRRDPSLFVAGFAAVLLLFVATGKQAFANYFFLVGAMFLMAVAMGEETHPGSEKQG
jgi:hypothetical protein